MALGAVMTVYLLSSLVQTVRKNYELNQEIADLQEEIDLLEVQQEELRYRIEYYKTEAFKEKEARAKLGLQLPGEGVIILPAEDDDSDKPKAKPPRSNLQQWWEFLFG
jgi:cell division protein FtsB